MFLSRKFANTRSTKALRDYFALAESQPTSATLLKPLEKIGIQKLKKVPMHGDRVPKIWTHVGAV